MILGAKKIEQLLKTGKPEDDPLVIIPPPKLQVGSASVDLRLGCWFAVLKQARASMLDIGATVSGNLSETALTKTHYVRFGDKFILQPRSFVLGITLEWLRLPTDIAGYVTSRSSWGRRGLIIATATGVHPGFTGCLTLELSNTGEIPVALYPGMAICQFFLHTVIAGSGRATRSALAGRRKPFLGAIKLDTIAKKIARECPIRQRS